MKVYLNLNENIKVKINDRGYDYLAKRYSEIMGSCIYPGSHSKYYKDRADAEGYTKMQIHEFMSSFGEVTHIGFITYFDPTILIEVNP